MKRGRYSEEERKAITNADCVEVARALGYEFNEKRSDRNAIRIKDQGGLFVWRNGSGWYCYSTGEKGRAVDLVKKRLGCEYREALDFIADNVLVQISSPYNYKENSGNTAVPKEPPKEFVLPEKAEKNNRVAAYLNHDRGISYKIINYAMENKILYQDKEHGNCCFVGYDIEGVPKYCAKRGTNSSYQFRGEVYGSDKNYSFKMMDSNTPQDAKLYIFESPIDAMSHAALNEIVGRDWKKDTRLSVGGCCYHPIDQHLKDFPGYSEIVICTDNDEKGILMAGKFEEKYSGEYKVTRRCSFAKDWNEDLKNINDIAKTNNISMKNAMNIYYNKCRETVEKQKQENFEKKSEQTSSEIQGDDENCDFSDEIEP